MSRRPVMDVLDQILSPNRPEDWRERAGLAAEFAPPQVAAAIEATLADPDADPASIRIAIDQAGTIALDDTPVEIGSVEPESFDFEPVTLTERVTAEIGPIELDFGAGTEAVQDTELEYEPGDEFGAPEPVTAEPHPEPLPDQPDHYDEAMPFEYPFEMEDDHSDDDDPFDV
jgi:hypothetical protein